MKHNHLIIELFKEMPKTNVYRVASYYDKTPLGFIRWEGRWRQYVYDTAKEDVMWSWECLEELKNFIVCLNNAHKKLMSEKGTIPIRDAIIDSKKKWRLDEI